MKGGALPPRAPQDAVDDPGHHGAMRRPARTFRGVPLLAFVFPPLLTFHGFAAGGLPSAEIPYSVGVNIHFTRGHTPDLDLIAAAGFRWVRMDFSWSGTERERGQYDFGPYEELTDNLGQRGLRALYILDYSNELYEEPVATRDPVFGRESRSPAAPRHPESRAAFARWAAAAASHFRNRGVIWEVWNEPNIGFWRPQPNVQDYAALLSATLTAVREADPTATIVAPATSEFPWDFLEGLFRAPGILDRLDAISVHPYRGGPPETVAPDYLRLRALIEQYTPSTRQPPPILSGEWGYPTPEGGLSHARQAAYLARQQLVNLLHAVPVSIWYDWKNDGTDPKEREHHFGTVTHDLQPKPAYRAIQTLTRQLAGFRIARRLELNDDRDQLLLLTDGAGTLRVAAWTTGEPHRVSTPIDLANPDDASIVDGQGQSQSAVSTNGFLALELQDAPQYISFRHAPQSLRAAAAWRIVEPFTTRVFTGPTNRLTATVELRNPFDRPARVILRSRPTAPRPDITIPLEAGQTHRCTVEWPLAQRDLEQRPVLLEVCYEGVHPAAAIPARETRLLVVANPLLPSVVPTAKGLQLRLHNPSGQAFNGRLVTCSPSTMPQVSEPPFPVRIPKGQLNFALAPLPLEPREPLTIEYEHSPVVAIQSHPPRLEPLLLPTLTAVLDGDSQLPATSSLVWTNAPANSQPPYPDAYRLDYQFAAGWRFVRCARAGGPEIPLPGQPQALGLWLLPDDSGNRVRTRVRDATGQTFQIDGPSLRGREWQWVVFPLTHLESAGHWGGAGDGIPRGGLTMDTLLLVDGRREATSGTVYFCAPTLLYAADSRPNPFPSPNP